MQARNILQSMLEEIEDYWPEEKAEAENLRNSGSDIRPTFFTTVGF
jgi:hypothetical protein